MIENFVQERILVRVKKKVYNYLSEVNTVDLQKILKIIRIVLAVKKIQNVQVVRNIHAVNNDLIKVVFMKVLEVYIFIEETNAFEDNLVVVVQETVSNTIDQTMV